MILLYQRQRETKFLEQILCLSNLPTFLLFFQVCPDNDYRTVVRAA